MSIFERFLLFYVDFCQFLLICHVDLCPVLTMSVEVADGGGDLFRECKAAML